MKVLIIGCGFLGKSLFEKLKNTQSVTVTKTKIGSHNNLYHLELLSPATYRKLDTLLEKFDVIIITAAAKNKEYYSLTYLHLARRIKHALQHKKNKTIIYTSSSGVYAENSGALVAENARLDICSSHELIEAEKTYLSLQRDHRVVIARLTGLIGPGRDLKKFYQKYLSESMAIKWVNFVDVEFAADFIKRSLQSHIRGIYNVSCCNLKNIDYFFKLFGSYPPSSYPAPIHQQNKRVCTKKMQSLI